MINLTISINSTYIDLVDTVIFVLVFQWCSGLMHPGNTLGRAGGGGT